MASPFRWVKRANAFLNVKTGMYVYKGDTDFEKLLDWHNARGNRIMKKLNLRL